MKRLFKWAGIFFAVLIVGLFAYGAIGWFDARSDAPAQQIRAQKLELAGQGGRALRADQKAMLIKVEDPTFYTNNGTDFSTPGAGKTTITQSLSKRLAFHEFKPGLRKIRQTGYAIGLSQSLSKAEVLTLFLHESSFRGSNGQWIKGFDAASRQFFKLPVAELDLDRFALLVASGIAPAELAPDNPNAKLLERSARIKRLMAGTCKLVDHGDVWLDGCKVNGVTAAK